MFCHPSYAEVWWWPFSKCLASALHAKSFLQTLNMKYCISFLSYFIISAWILSDPGASQFLRLSIALITFSALYCLLTVQLFDILSFPRGSLVYDYWVVLCNILTIFQSSFWGFMRVVPSLFLITFRIWLNCWCFLMILKKLLDLSQVPLIIHLRSSAFPFVKSACNFFIPFRKPLLYFDLATLNTYL